MLGYVYNLHFDSLWIYCIVQSFCRRLTCHPRRFAFYTSPAVSIASISLSYTYIVFNIVLHIVESRFCFPLFSIFCVCHFFRCVFIAHLLLLLEFRKMINCGHFAIVSGMHKACMYTIYDSLSRSPAMQ